MTSSPDLKVAYVSSSDPSDREGWSGTGYYMPKALRDAGLSLDLIAPVGPPLPLSVWARRAFYKCFGRSTYLYERDPDTGRKWAAEVQQRLSPSRHDLVFSVGGHLIAYLESDLPVVYWADATFQAMVDFYPDFSNLSERSQRDGNAMERAALRRSTLAFFASDWAARSAINDYGADPAKVHVVPFGANLDPVFTDDEVAAAVAARPRDVVRLLFIGVDWSRKGGRFAVEVAELLNSEGLRAELTIVGCDPPLPESARTFTRVHGTIDKGDRKGRAELAGLLAQSHFLILPSHAECFGLVLCEANAHGTPCLTTDVGGISTIIRQDVNGKMFDRSAPAKEWASYAAALFADARAYQELARSSYAEYRQRLNWGVSARTVRQLLQETLGSR